MSVSVNLKGLEDTFKEVDTRVIELVNQGQRLNALQAVNDLVQVTPVDTGRARSSWALSSYPGVVRDNTGERLTSGSIILGPVSNNTIEQLYITNGAPYIQDLNLGSSLQAPPRFIEKTIGRYFNLPGAFVRVI
eukprot:GHVL01025250.1.p1 GENE.GHVL01025250.1~~GHVL01025250.1.p1  ORF type:complete len:134 (+),score=10.77 GHVL01025250.1:930-1331(+)